MKKIMIALGAIAMAAAVNAATVSWSVYSIEGPVSGDFSGPGYLFNSAEVDIDLVTAALADGSFYKTYVETESYAYASEAADGELVEEKILKGTEGETTLYTVLVDNEESPSYYWVSDEQTKTLGASGDKPFSWDGVAQSDWQSVPEPTSGLLLLLGVAGLALRRRRA